MQTGLPSSYWDKISSSKSWQIGGGWLTPVMVQVKRDLRAGDHALAEHYKDDYPERLQSEHDEGLPSGGDARRQLGAEIRLYGEDIADRRGEENGEQSIT